MEKYTQPFIATCKHVFRDFIGVDIIAKTPYFIDSTDEFKWDISGIIGLAGEVQGAVVLSLKSDLAMMLTERLTQTRHTEMNDDVYDAIGEIINIIAGNVKKDLEDVFKIVISLPTIIKGENHHMVWLKSQSTRKITIPFEVLNTHSFCLSVSLKKV